MDSVGNTVSYCCVWKRGGQLLYKYNNSGGGGGGEIDELAASCLELTPRYHRWYFETSGRHTFGFLMDPTDGHVYFTIVCKSHGNSQLLQFLQTLRDEFRRISTTTSLGCDSMQEQLFPVVLGLAASLEQWPPAAALGNISNVVDDAPLLGNTKTNKGPAVMNIETEERNRGCGSGNNSRKKKWCRRVRIVLAIDAAFCTLLFIIWLVICHGTQCIR